MRCDSHVHIVGPLDRYPQVAERTYQADIATLKQLENVSATRAVRRFVIVQPSFYGVDNSLLLESIDALAGRGRGVGVINPRVTSARTLATYAAQGVRGLRINLYSPLREKAPLTNRFSAIAGIAHELNWHIEVIAPLSMLSENATLLEKSSVPVVIDRYGVYGSLDPCPAGKPRFAEVAGDAACVDQTFGTLPRECKSARDQTGSRLACRHSGGRSRPCVWGSDWPHTPPHDEQFGSNLLGVYRNLRYEMVVDDLMAAVGSAELAERILADNPARLYEF